MVTLDELNKQIEEHQAGTFIFKRSLVEGQTDKEILDSFKALLANKPVGYWLIRESRVDGALSLTTKRESGVDHYRFAFVEGRWVDAKHLHRVEARTPVSLDNIGDKGQQLLELVTHEGFEKKFMLLPKQEECTKKSIYVQSTYMVIGQSHALFNNPAEAIQRVWDKLSRETSPDSPEIRELAAGLGGRLIAESDTLLIKKLFLCWLQTQGLAEQLTCSVTLDLLSKPYALSESGQSFDQEALPIFQSSGRCPLTRAEITHVPYRVGEYQSVLQDCLHLFTKMINAVSQAPAITGPGAFSIFSQAGSSSAVPDDVDKNSMSMSG